MSYELSMQVQVFLFLIHCKLFVRYLLQYIQYYQIPIIYLLLSGNYVYSRLLLLLFKLNLVVTCYIVYTKLKIYRLWEVPRSIIENTYSITTPYTLLSPQTPYGLGIHRTIRLLVNGKYNLSPDHYNLLFSHYLLFSQSIQSIH